MLGRARAKAAQAGLEANVTFLRGDVRTLSLGTTFDAAIAMFAVLGYLPTDRDLDDALAALRRHLAPEGLLIFDVWFGPGVLREPPSDRVKTVTIAGAEITRTAAPTLNLASQTVDVHYRFTRRAGSGATDDVTEVHTVRFFFPRELTASLERAGFEAVSLHPFGRPDQPLTPDDWQLGVVAKAV
jgi:SAM-dependent methyltransferase